MTRRTPEHGGVPWYLMFTIVAAIGIGFVVYRVMHKRGLAEAAERARAPKPASRPVEAAPQPEPEPTPVPEEAPVPEAAEVTPPSECDEVSCVLNNYEGACCQKYKKPRTRADGELPESLDRAMIAEGIAKVKPHLVECASLMDATGKVKAKVNVAPDGHVTVVTIDSQSDPKLGACVQKLVKVAVFAKTQTGGSFSYPFTF